MASCFLLIFLNGFFVAAEFSFVRIRGTRLEELAKEGSAEASFLLKMLEALDTYLSTAQIGITATSLAIGWLGVSAAAAFLKPLIDSSPLPVPDWLAVPLAIALGFGLTVFFQNVLCELVPRTLALQKVETVALGAARPIYIFSRLIRPFVRFFNKSAHTILRFLPVGAAADNHTPEELRMIIGVSERAGVIDSMGSRIIDNALDFSDLLAREVMTPRQDVICLYAERPFAENLKIVRKSVYTRYPLCQGDKDHIIGMVHIRGIIALLFAAPGKRDLRQVMREIVTIPEGLSAADAFRTLQKRRLQLAIVADEYGGTAGIVTVEDLMEKLVGDLQDEYDQEEEPLLKNPDGSFEFDGLMLLGAIEEILEISLPEHDADTLGGYIFGLLGRRPQAGDRVSGGGYDFEVVRAKGFRVERIKAVKKNNAENGD
ncbi:MAG: hemolysin family protein, partial [Acidaminococcales bacterium]|nr:hemolysin family protein [Acidaminococcales bacterium]